MTPSTVYVSGAEGEACEEVDGFESAIGNHSMRRRDAFHDNGTRYQLG